MLILAATLLALALVPLTGGRLGRLADVRLWSRWLVAYALALQVLASSIVPDWPRPVVVALHASSYVLASPSWLPLQNVYSVGDLLILAGAVWLVHRTCGTVLARDPGVLLRRARRLRQAWALTAELAEVPAQRPADRALTPSAGR